MPTAQELNDAAQAVVDDSAKLHAVVHGAFDDPDVITEGGNIKPLAKILKPLEDGVAASDPDNGYGFGLNESGAFDFCLWDEGTNTLRRCRLFNGALRIVD